MVATQRPQLARAAGELEGSREQARAPALMQAVVQAARHKIPVAVCKSECRWSCVRDVEDRVRDRHLRRQRSARSARAHRLVKKNAILMIDFALEAERTHGLDPREAIFEACMMRFRPIMMTTSAAMLGALPLALSFGDGGELRRPLGISIVGGLMVSQVLTLYTTPVVYLYLDRFRLAAKRQWHRAFPGLAAPEAAE